MSGISPIIVLAALVLLFFLTASLILIVYFLPTSYNERDESSNGPPRYQILVLGDIGRSPRMQYHAISMGKYGGPVDLVGYLGMLPCLEEVCFQQECRRARLLQRPLMEYRFQN